MDAKASGTVVAKPRALYLSDLLTGLVAALAERRISALSIRNNQFDRAMARLVNDDVAREATDRGFALRFRIQPHELHGDSSAVQSALYEAAQRDLISLDNPEYQDVRLKISEDEAPGYYEDLPGDAEMYRQFATKLLRYYRELSP